MFFEIGVLAAGVAPGYLLRKNKKAYKPVSQATMLSIYALLFVLGARIGGDDAIFDAIGQLGAQALIIGFACTMGSAMVAVLAGRFFRDQFRPAQAAAGPSESDQTESQRKNGLCKALCGSVIILGFFSLGLALSRLGILPPAAYEGDMTLYMLWAMLFMVGMGVGFDIRALLVVKELGLRVLLVPLLTIAGTALGAFIASLFIAQPFGDCLTVGIGLGYYSLSSVVVTELGGAALGSIALLANLFRELFCLLATPLIARGLGPLAPVAAAAAPGMDTCLPIIAQSTNERFVIIALFNGLALTMLVPLLIPLVITAFS
ncbi:MAG: lysine exporter LysO family protein [Deltaproteobacteria bacterium]|nr:lysine exporter LysO family protein [Deltaproteobacteria bacterium]